MKTAVRLINWPNFNIVTFQGIGRPEDRQRDRRRASQRGGWNTAFIDEFDHLIWMSFTASQNNYNSDTKDLWSQITITNLAKSSVFEILWQLTKQCDKCQTDTEVSTCFWKNHSYILAYCRIMHTNLQCVKQSNLWRTVMWSKIKQACLHLYSMTCFSQH